MNRRDALLTLLAVGAAPQCLLAQQPGKVWRIGFLWGNSASTGRSDIDAILHRLRELGYVEGQNFAAEYRWANGDAKSLPALAAELVRLKVDLIVTRSTPAAIAAKSASHEIPVVFSMVSDPVASRIVDSLARPGGNVTGWANILPDTSEKLLEFLKESVPRMSRVAVLSSPDNAGKVLEVKKLQAAAAKIGVTLHPISLRLARDVDAAFARMPEEHIDALVVLSDSVTTTNRQHIVDLAGKIRLPAIYQVGEFVEAGGLMSYGLNMLRQQSRTADYIHRIFTGAKPADLPIEQPTKIELVMNLKTARELGLKIPPSVLLRAERVIE